MMVKVNILVKCCGVAVVGGETEQNKTLFVIRAFRRAIH
jgi:hypothetical protein